MKKSHLLGAVCAVGFVGTANASLIDITATSNNPDFTGFTLQFDDTSGDGLLQIDEYDMALFSGFTISGLTGFNGFYDDIIGTPDIAGISTSSGIALGNPGDNWNFLKTDDTGACCGPENWLYSSVVVPIPAALWLFGSGLLCIVGIARRKKAA